MSIASKHAYRFGYLKSEQWKTVRIEALAREGAKCQICMEESIFNDAHHAWYPENIWETTERHLIVLCRGCHDFLHAVMPECKTNNEKNGTESWLKLKNSILAWRMCKASLFTNPPVSESGRPVKVKELRDAYDLMKKQFDVQESVIKSYREKFGMIIEDTIKVEAEGVGIDALCKTLCSVVSDIKKWGNEARKNSSLDYNDYVI